MADDYTGDDSTQPPVDYVEDPSSDPTNQPPDPTQDPSYDPFTDPANYDYNNNYIGPGAYDDQGNWLDPMGQGWNGDTPGVPVTGPDGSTSPKQGGSGLISKIGGLLTKGNVGNLLRGGGQAIGGAEKAAVDARALQAKLALEANAQNISGMSATEQALMNRAHTEMAQRQQEQRNMARGSYMQHPFQSPFAPSTGPRFSSQYMNTAQQQSDQAAQDLGQAPMYGSRSMPALQSYTPINIKDIPGATGTTPSTGSNIGNYVGPGLSLLGMFLNRNKPQDDTQQTTGGGY